MKTTYNSCKIEEIEETIIIKFTFCYYYSTHVKDYLGLRTYGVSLDWFMDLSIGMSTCKIV